MGHGKKTKLSIPLLLTVLVPIVGGVLFFALVLISFEVARDIAVDEQEKKIGELVELTGSSIQRLWIQPRNNTVLALSRSSTLHKRIEGNISFGVLAQEWEHAQQVLEGYFFIYYGLEDGSIEYYPDGELPEGYDPRDRPWYEAGMKSEGEPAWTAPYEEAITGEMVVSTVVPIKGKKNENDEKDKIGVMSTDITFSGLEEILEKIQLPRGGSVFLVDQSGRPFIGTKEEYVTQEELPESSEKLFVKSSTPLSNGWRVSVMVPRTSLIETFKQLRRPIITISAFLVLIGIAIVTILAWRIASRAHRLADYFTETVEESKPLRRLFKTRDEFLYLNKQFNYVVHNARFMEEEKLARERTFRFLIEQAPVGFFKSHKDGSLLYINPHCAAMLGYTQEEALEQVESVRHLYYDTQDREQFLKELSEKREVRHKKIRFLRKNGELIWISMTARIVPTTDDKEEYEIEGFLIDITGDMEERESLKILAGSDPLTGAANRRAFDAAIEKAALHAISTGESVALIMFDLDKFKEINDTYGHDVGDILLRHVVTVAQKLVRGSDLFARLGGDEFSILLPGSTEKAAFKLAERLQKGIESTTPPKPLSTMPTLSIGISVRSGTEVKASDLMRAADYAMYQAKQTGRNAIKSASDVP
ncbi:MAG: diguanylate cyclase [Spirochaetia bacterium]|nr:diguanylate cyclase [Spirochaetia bacterium]